MTLALGLDVGTQGTKGLLLDVNAGAVVARAGASYDLLPDLPPGAAEQHPQTWLDAVDEVVGRLLAGGESPGGEGDGQALSVGGVDPARIASIGVSGQQHGCVVLDAADRVVRPAKLWCDTSTAAEARELSGLLGRVIPTGFTASKLLWLKRHEPEAFAATRLVLLPHDFVNLHLTGEATMEAGDASGTGFFDVRARTFDERAVTAIDHRLGERLPRLLAPGEMAGALRRSLARRWGLRPGIPVAAGGGDNMMSALGSGASTPGVVVMSLGTSGTVFTYSDSPVEDPEGLIAPFCDSTGGWLPLLCVMNVTGVTGEVAAAFEGASLERLTAEAEATPPGCDGLLFLPYLQGERVPDLPDASGCLLGLRPGGLRPGSLFRAALEGTALNLAWGTDRLRRLGVPVDGVRIVGGGAANPLWRRILAAALDARLELVEEPESGALGAALAGLWTARRLDGEDVTAHEVAAPFVRTTGEVAEPESELVSVYAESRARFVELTGRVFGA